MSKKIITETIKEMFGVNPTRGLVYDINNEITKKGLKKEEKIVEETINFYEQNCKPKKVKAFDLV